MLAETVAGGTWLLYLTPLWSEVKRGFFTLTASVLAILALATWFAVSAGRIDGHAAGLWSLRFAAATAIALVVDMVLMLARRRTAARVAGFAAVPLSLAMLVAMAGTSDGSHVAALLQLLAGAAFLGAVIDGLLLGHWYLTDRGLTRTPINRTTNLLLAGVVLEALALILGGFGPTQASADFNPLLTSAGLASWIALGMVGTTALIAVMVHLTLRGERASAVQSATGFFYLAVVTAFTAEVAVKVRFLPG